MKTKVLMATFGLGAAMICARLGPVASAPSQVTVPITREKFDPLANPKRDLQTALAQAQRRNQRVILDVGGEWCGWCREMDLFLSRETRLQKLRDRNYVWVKVNFSAENPNRAFLSQYPAIKGYPHLFVLDKTGKLLLSKHTEELEDGKSSYDRQKFAAFLLRYAPPKSAAP